MSSIAGWVGAGPDADGVLGRMVGAMSGPRPAVELHEGDGLAVGTTRPALLPAESHLAQSDDESTVLAFAGYLHSEDPRQRTHPAEHCLELYEQLGDDFPLELNGSFGIAIHDRPRGALLLVADRTATRALYYCAHQGLIFGSEVKAILECPGVSRQLNPVRLCEFVAIMRLVGLNTHYDHIRPVPGGTMLVWDGAECRLIRYWTPRFDYADAPDIREHAEHALAVLCRAMARVCAGATRVGIMLSGGLDSRTMAATANVPLLCMTVHTDDAYEVGLARRVAAALGHEHRFVRLPRRHPLELLGEGAVIGDGMHVYHSAQGLALREIIEAEGLSLVLNGYRLETNFRSTTPARTMLEAFGKRLTVPFPADERVEDAPEAFMAAARVAPVATLRRLLRAVSWDDLAADLKRRLRDIVRASASNVTDGRDAIELVYGMTDVRGTTDYLNLAALDRLAVVGFVACDSEIVDLMLATPPRYRFRHRMYAFMHARMRSLRGIPYSGTGVPVSTNVWWEWINQRLRWRARRLHARLRRALDPAYQPLDCTAWPPVGRALRECADGRALLRSYASDSRLVDLGAIHGDAIRDLVEHHIDRRASSDRALSAWLTVEEWLRRYA